MFSNHLWDAQNQWHQEQNENTEKSQLNADQQAKSTDHKFNKKSRARLVLSTALTIFKK